MPIEKDTILGLTKKIRLPLLSDNQFRIVGNMINEPETFTHKELGNMVAVLKETLAQAEEFLVMQGRVARASLAIVNKRRNIVNSK